MIHFQVDRYFGMGPLSTKRLHQTLVSTAQAASPAIQVSPPTLPPSAGLSTRECREVVRKYELDLECHKRRAEEARQLAPPGRREESNATLQSVANLTPEQFAAAKRDLFLETEKKRQEAEQARILAAISRKFSKGK